MKRHANIPVFIPHLGCPNQCVFCNQRTISGVQTFDVQSVPKIINSALETIGENVETEIAFFGGSFTGIDRDLMINLLKIADSYVKIGKVSSIRCSTRPDYIDEEVLSILKKYSVKVIELGLQSTNDRVLDITKRGHNFEIEKRACEIIVKNGFSLVGQMMIGLPGSSIETERETADFIISSGASGVRIYPTVVFHDTELCSMTNEGLYTPLSLEEAVERSACVMEKFIDVGIDVIRVGLCSSDNLLSDKTYFAGPNHSAIGELVENKIFYNAIKKELLKLPDKKSKIITVFIPQGALSKAIGQKKINKIKLEKDFSNLHIKFKEAEYLTGYSVSIREERQKDVLKDT